MSKKPQQWTRPSGPTVRPITEGYEVKGGKNPPTSQISARPAPPAPMPSRIHGDRTPPKRG